MSGQPVWTGKKRGAWLNAQRQAFRAGTLAEWQLEALALDDIVLEVKPITDEETFYGFLNQLRGQVQSKGSCSKALSVKCSSEELREWARGLRLDRVNSALRDEMIAALDELGFEWDLQEAKWDEVYEDLKIINDELGSMDKSVLSQKLYSWITLQRKNKCNGVLSEKRIQKLDEIGMSWETRDGFFERNLKKLADLYESHGTVNPRGMSTKNKKLYQILTYFKQLRKENKLNDDQITKLDNLNFPW